MYRIFLLLLSFAFFACSNSEYIYSQQNVDSAFESDTLDNMVVVRHEKKEVLLGTNEGAARANERPQMRVTLNYDFSIGKSEVTCAEFNSLMKSSKISVPCEKDAYPATNLTYYDAVLFANARSKKEGFDTAYTYSNIELNSEKHCVNLEGFAFHPEVNAYRLPTEAEWSFVAGRFWSAKDAWTADNSDYHLHAVCSKFEKAQVCDMIGNAMEWMNDWLGNFRDTTVMNYVGAPDGGALGQRVVKGGSYRTPAESITLYGRGDVYTVTSSTRADYVGFRLAFGAIPDALWMNSDGKAAGSRVIPLASSSTIKSLFDTYRVKLVFRNDLSGNLSFVDYSNGALSVVEIEDTLNVYHPDISPDGKMVAFSTKLEGVSGKSSVYVRNLDAEGSALVKLDVKSAAIPRWRVLENGDTVIVYVNDAGNNKDDATFKSTSTWQVKFSKGKFGEPKKLFDGAYHGGISEDQKLAVTGARLLRVNMAGETEVWYNGEQACNASLSQDSSKRTMFLDFASKTGRDYVGSKYGTHERILVADSTGKLIQSVGAPKGYSFDHSEWVPGDHNMAVATFTNANGAHTKIVLVNLSDSSVVELAEGDELWHPALWVNTAFTGYDDLLALDSAGVYYGEGLDIESEKSRIKMELYWKNLDVTEVLLVGSSRMEMGVDPDAYPEWNMLNTAISGIDGNRDMYFVENYALNHSDNLKAIVMSLDLDNWSGREDHLRLIHMGVPGYDYDAHHDFWKSGLPSGFIEAVENAYPASQGWMQRYSARGGLDDECRGWDADGTDVLMDSVFTKQEDRYLDARLNELAEIVDSAAAKNIYVVGIIFPMAPQYKKTGSFGTYGLQRSKYPEKKKKLDSLAKANRYFVLMDENKNGDHDYTDQMSFNRDHLCVAGKKQMTDRLDSVLKTLKW
ncbi:TIGR02171 family protein [Fibrobacter succinogenes]|uniref:TIGR02171 family lipoprotein n=1 Tax=Fibrobacter succinogenes TaxID=833 RepID=UPI0013D517E8|nr:TIGR02171 family protein [Fibrobacter succinogenes]